MERILLVYHSTGSLTTICTSLIVLTLNTQGLVLQTQFRSFLKPYWDQKLKDLHAVMRQRRRNWIIGGKPRGGGGGNDVSYRTYKNAKCQLRSQHRKCAENYSNDLNKDIDEAAELDSAFFWKKSTRSVKDLHQAQVLKWNFYNVMSAVIHSRFLLGRGNTFKIFMRTLREIIMTQN